MRFFLFFLVFHCLEPALAKGKSRGLSTDRSVLLFIAGDYLYANTSADRVEGASYTERFSRPTVASLGLDVLFTKKLFIGARYEYWIARRRFDLNGVRTDTLIYQTVGLELGFFHRPNPRVYFLAAVGAHYPVTLRVASSGTVNGNFENAGRPLGYATRLATGIRFNSLLSLFFEGGYRLSNLKKLRSGSEDLVEGGGDLDLSSAFLGGGFGFEF